ncbi:MAG: PQQ-like beta-propeller repeat protein [Sedimentisphaerales bacterium]|nr:PQQ-like beta-propeller repeat protein [Sedimentisphaerales bacterium]
MPENQLQKLSSLFPTGIYRLIPITIFVFGIISLILWLSNNPVKQFTVRLPSERDLAAPDEQGSGGIITGTLVTLNGVPSDLPGSWPHFRGINFDAILSEQAVIAPIHSEPVRLADNWPESGPEVLWSKDLGEGFAGAAVLNGRVYLIDYDQQNNADLIRCMSLDDGEDIWQYSYPVKVKRNHGMSRTVPVVTEKYLVTIGPKCHVTCLDPITGEFKWMLDLVKDYGTKVPEWYAGQCPIIEDDKAIIAPGGEPLMMAVDCNSGEILWQTPNPNEWGMTHNSIVPADILGMHVYLYCTTGGVVAVNAEDGSLLWEYPDWKIKLANVSCPIVVGDDKVFLSGGYNSGAQMVQLSLEDEKITSQLLFELDSKTFGAEQQTPIHYDNHIWAVRPDKEFVCIDLDGNVVWTSSRTNRFGPQGLGPFSIADGKIYILDDDGTLTLAEATTTGYKQLSQSKVLEGPDAWAPMAFASGRLIIRDMNKMICLDISAK